MFWTNRAHPAARAQLTAMEAMALSFSQGRISREAAGRMAGQVREKPSSRAATIWASTFWMGNRKDSPP